jgi:hypothetical protein
MPAEYEQYRKALALNNIGVSLLERNHHREALATMQHAVEAIRGGVFPLTDNEQTIVGPISFAETRGPTTSFDLKIQEASRWLACSRTLPDTSNYLVLSLNDGLEAVEKLLKSSWFELFDNVSLLLKIDSFDDGNVAETADVHGAVILHNFAAAHLSLSRRVKSPLAAAKLLHGAYLVAQMALSTISSLLNADCGPQWSAEERFFYDGILLLVTVAALKSLVRISEERRDFPTTAEYCNRLFYFEAVVREMPLSELLSPERLSAACAA